MKTMQRKEIDGIVELVERHIKEQYTPNDNDIRKIFQRGYCKYLNKKNEQNKEIS